MEALRLKCKWSARAGRLSTYNGLTTFDLDKRQLLFGLAYVEIKNSSTNAKGWRYDGRLSGVSLQRTTF